MSNRGQVWDHKSLLKPKSFSKSPLDRILVPDYKFMVAIIDRIVWGSILRKICIFLENKYSHIHINRDSFFSVGECILLSPKSRTIVENRNALLLMWIRLYNIVNLSCFCVKNFETNQISANRMRQNEIIDSFYCLDRLEIQSVQL